MATARQKDSEEEGSERERRTRAMETAEESEVLLERCIARVI